LEIAFNAKAQRGKGAVGFAGDDAVAQGKRLDILSIRPLIGCIADHISNCMILSSVEEFIIDLLDNG
jgi:hypothetical protein